MKKSEFVPPELRKDGFNCPHCGAYTQQRWGFVGIYSENANWGMVLNDIVDFAPMGAGVQMAICMKCKEFSFWVNSKMVFPNVIVMDSPNEDLSDDITADYMEAADVLQKSPRAAAALLRLALQKLCKQLGGKGENIRQDIGLLVKEKGLSAHAADAMDSIRIVGNHAVHPGEFDLRGDTTTATILFDLINFIAETMLTEPKKRKAFYEKLPDSKKWNNDGKGE